MDLKVKTLLALICVTAVGMFPRGCRLRNFFSHYQSTSCACDKCSSEGDPWFTQRFNKSVAPFLSSEYNLTEEAFNWWKRMQGERGSLSSFSKTVEGLFQVVPPRPDLEEHSPYRCRTCAVVGNSGNLKGSHYGALINFQDVVIRMNNGRVEGYEADVGNRTTHRIMYPESAMNLENNTHLVLFPFKIQDLLWVTKALTTGFHGTSYRPVKSKIKANKDLVMVVNPAFMKYVHETWLGKKGRYPSTGFMALIMALHICDEIHVFGYGADNDGNWSHYWEVLRDKSFRTGVHPGNHEYDTILKLTEQQKIQFYSGW
ncbi:CMP-N-acetylneuraminate-beta-galactosamide-alpha-2,3-sialyltransferase 1-like [Notolabrus celidotus]|uniref:CMP-N-acetylneuraminate-beta-galactosamide- alpha-2,3-sialyltransferase 1-like n=1 Tax=Notolabrus celidotus TaxID=1203425 RepID=UPI00148F5BA2|nr:CMP-N-acetylneuraminate-beta-galactosamide-alpha-2,3-sialyltransferase 1-like [Notolabrus celidotus]